MLAKRCARVVNLAAATNPARGRRRAGRETPPSEYIAALALFHRLKAPLAAISASRTAAFRCHCAVIPIQLCARVKTCGAEAARLPPLSYLRRPKGVRQAERQLDATAVPATDTAYRSRTSSVTHGGCLRRRRRVRADKGGTIRSTSARNEKTRDSLTSFLLPADAQGNTALTTTGLQRQFFSRPPLPANVLPNLRRWADGRVQGAIRQWLERRTHETTCGRFFTRHDLGGDERVKMYFQERCSLAKWIARG